jgi:hypothetical protein
MFDETLRLHNQFHPPPRKPDPQPGNPPPLRRRVVSADTRGRNRDGYCGNDTGNLKPSPKNPTPTRRQLAFPAALQRSLTTVTGMKSDCATPSTVTCEFVEPGGLMPLDSTKKVSL